MYLYTKKVSDSDYQCQCLCHCVGTSWNIQCLQLFKYKLNNHVSCLWRVGLGRKGWVTYRERLPCYMPCEAVDYHVQFFEVWWNLNTIWHHGYHDVVWIASYKVIFMCVEHSAQILARQTMKSCNTKASSGPGGPVRYESVHIYLSIYVP